MKKCSKCFVEKSETEFHIRRDTGRLRNECKLCRAALVLAWVIANPERHRTNKARWKSANPEKVAAGRQRHYAANREKIDLQVRAWRAKNKEKCLAITELWRKEHLEFDAARSAKQRAEKVSATPAWANSFFIDEIYDLAARRTALKTGGIAKWHVDHIVPMKGVDPVTKEHIVCGLHVEHNLRVIPAVENLKKHNKTWPHDVGFDKGFKL
jgi:hypothetical protein